MRRALVFILLILLVGSLQAQEEPNSISYSGVFKGAPLFIQNPFLPEQKSFSIQEILVNNQAVNTNYNKSAIMLRFEKTREFTPVAIRIFYFDSTNVPVLLNPDAITYHSVFSFEQVIISDSSIYWKTKGEQEDAKYVVERLFYGIWQPVTTMTSKGVYGGSDYNYYPIFEEGINKFRVKYVKIEKELFSQEVEHVYYPEPIEVSQKGSKVTLSRPCQYVITSFDNVEFMSGSGKEIDISPLKNGEYYLTLNENQVEIIRQTEKVPIIRLDKSNN